MGFKSAIATAHETGCIFDVLLGKRKRRLE
jgi:hypothetical protein